MSGPSFDPEASRLDLLDSERRLEVISAYLDGELSPDAARHVTSWLDQNPDALREVEHLRRLWDLLDLYGDEPVPEGFSRRVLDGALGRRRRARPLLLVAAAAVVTAGLALGIHALTVSGPTTDDAVSEQASAQRAPVDLAEVPPDLLEDVDVLLSLSDEEFEGVLIADLEKP